MVLPGYDDWKTREPHALEIDAEFERLSDHAGQLAEVESDGSERYTLWFRGSMTAEEIVELLDVRHAQIRRAQATRATLEKARR